jgi:putative phosphoesterase
MTKIGILSDTHGSIEPKLYEFFASCETLFHAGDIGTEAVADELAAFKPLVAVHGNIDGWELRSRFPAVQRVKVEDAEILMTHIGGYPGRYEPRVYPMLRAKPPQIFIAGHSHLLKVMYDSALGLLHINPGAMGNSGIHRVRTAVRLDIDGYTPKNLEVLELPRKGMSA